MTNKVNLGEVDDRSRSYTTSVERPDQYTALDHSRATVEADRETAIVMVTTGVGEAARAKSIDEFTSDFMDATIEAARVGWDAATDVESAKRLHTTIGLMAVELENVTRIAAVVAAQRQTVADLQAAVTGWRSVLLGHTVYAPQPAGQVGHTVAAAPQLRTVPVTSTIADQLAVMAPAAPTTAPSSSVAAALPAGGDQDGDDSDQDGPGSASSVSYLFDKDAK